MTIHTCLLYCQGRGRFLLTLMSSSFETVRNEGLCNSNGDKALISASKSVEASIPILAYHISYVL